MRIALMIHALYGGGAEKLLADLAGRWAANHEVHLITWAREETDTYAIPNSVIRHGLDLMRDSPNPIAGLLANRRRVLSLRQCLQKISPDLIVSFSDRTNIVALQAAKPLSVPIWISEHSDPARQKLGRIWETWRRWTYPSCTGCTVLTPHIAETMQQWVRPHKIRVIPPAIQDHRLTNTSNNDASSSAAAPPYHVLFLGRLSAEKRVDVLLDAWGKIEADFPEWKLQIVGDGELREKLEQQAVGAARVDFCGWCDRPMEYLSTAQVFALSSDYEGFPVSLLEAMDCGIACVTTNCTKAIDVINQDAECVLTVPTGSAAALAEQLRKLCSNASLRKQLGERAQTRAGDFHWSKIGPLWDELLTAQ